MASAIPETVISHWSRLFEDFQTSPLDFYISVEAAIACRQIPDTTTERIEYKEGGVVSAHREYLRVKRGKHVFDICAAPFGTGFFFSAWLAEVPLLTGLQKFLIMTGLVFVLAFLLYQSLLVGLFMFGLFLFLGLAIMAMLESDVDDAIMELPLIGRLYTAVFRPVTYYKIDTGLMFQSATHAALLETIDALTTAQGIRAMTELERKPILKAFAQKA